MDEYEINPIAVIEEIISLTYISLLQLFIMLCVFQQCSEQMRSHARNTRMETDAKQWNIHTEVTQQ